jgi:protein involved in polysaccharide export with SLBB domain
MMTRTGQLLAMWSATFLMAGCSTSGNSALGIFPSGQRLLPETQEVRQANPSPWPVPRELNKSVAAPYTVEPGDVLLIQPADFDSPIRIPGDQPVLLDGSIQLGKFGRIVVAGMTVEQIEQVVQAHVRAVLKDVGPITVRLSSRQSKVFYVLGEVNAPGAFPLAGRETVLDAILAAGGVNSRADLRKITLSRPTPPESCRVVLPICYEQIVQLGDTSTNYQIHAGDRIFVPSKCFLDDVCRAVGKKCPTCDQPQIPCTSPDGCPDGSCSSWHPAPRR